MNIDKLKAIQDEFFDVGIQIDEIGMLVKIVEEKLAGERDVGKIKNHTDRLDVLERRSSMLVFRFHHLQALLLN